MKETAIGGFVMAKGYRHMQEYEKEMIERIEKGDTLREIGEKFGFTYAQMRNFKTRCAKKQKKIEAGIAIKRKGRPPKDYQVSEEDFIKSLFISNLKHLLCISI